MTKQFILATDPLTVVQERALREKIGSVGWWHWLPNFWLINDQSERLTVKLIRDAVKEVEPTARCLALEVVPTTWAALSRKDAKGRDGMDWIKKNWS